MKRTRIIDRKVPDYTRSEEIFNAVSHIAGGGVAVVALVACVVVAALHNNKWGIITGMVYGVTMIILYTMSSVYHGLVNKGTSKKVFQVIDHCAIFLLIAGTYTPFLLCSLRPAHPVFGWVLFSIVWASAFLGVTLNAIDLKKYAVFSMAYYICSGWLIFTAIKPLLEVLPVNAFIFLFGGGAAYTVGAVLFGLGRKIRFMHSLFHIFVVAGSILHFFSIVLYVM
jgi:hemolysin III